MFNTILAYFETQFSTSIKLLRSDSGGEYMSYEFKKSFLTKELSRNALTDIQHNKMELLSVKIVIF